MPLIREVIVTTVSPAGDAHIAPMGIREENNLVLLQPFRPSTTLENVLGTRCAVVNYTDDVRIFAGCLTGRRDWPTVPVNTVRSRRLEAPLAHRELELERVEEDEVRPRLWCRSARFELHAPFRGFNRAQAAVLEGAILVSRLHMLPMEKIEAEVQYLAIAISKTAGPGELEAWGWLMERIETHRANAAAGAAR
jgi:hypothetical protein